MSLYSEGRLVNANNYNCLSNRSEEPHLQSKRIISLQKLQAPTYHSAKSVDMELYYCVFMKAKKRSLLVVSTRPNNKHQPREPINNVYVYTGNVEILNLVLCGWLSADVLTHHFKGSVHKKLLSKSLSGTKHPEMIFRQENVKRM